MSDLHPQPIRYRRRQPACPRRMAMLPLILLLSLSGTTVTGCGGCSGCKGGSSVQAKKEKEEEDRKKKAEELKKKQPLTIGQLGVDPHDQSPILALKRGHWASAELPMKANLENFVGNLELAVVDKNNRPLDLDRMPYRMLFSRPVALSQGREKNVQTTFFTPSRGDPPGVTATLRKRGGVIMNRPSRRKAQLMPPYQYHFVVLAKTPARYTYIKTLDAVTMPNGGEAGGSEAFTSDNDEHYRVVLPNIEKNVPLPESPLIWSTIAYVLWDDVEPDRLSLDQRTALVDWLHWGGQLIVSGPGTLDLLRGSFLDPHLPAENGGATKIEQGQLDPLSRSWKPKKTRQNDGRLRAAQPWSGIALKVRRGATAPPGASGLVAEKRVGRGRIVVTAFRLDEPDFVNWKSVHGFYNACLMRRPARKWSWADFAKLEWADSPERRLDARLMSRLRFFSRDSGVQTNFQKKIVDESDPDSRVWQQLSSADQPQEEWIPPEEAPGGVAAWNDFSESAGAARESLRIAAGVTVPKAGFVLGVLAVYLVVLVPLNWLFFHAIGRVEWAWIAAPFIAIAGTMVVVWQAQLDIGFVRAQTDVTLVEVHGDYPRAHVTRFTALYTSLGTQYDFQFDNRTSLIKPFPARANYQMIEGQSRSDVVFRKHQDVRLTGFGVLSNTTNMVRSEQFIDLAGPIRLGTSSLGHPQIINGSQWDLIDTAIVRRLGSSSELQGCWIGRLRPGTASAVSFQPIPSKTPMPFLRERKAAARTRIGEVFPLDPLIRLGLDPAMIRPGMVQLVATIDGILPGMKITPVSSQTRGAAMVVVHLKQPPLPDPEPDVNHRADVERLDSNSDALDF